MNNIRVIPVLSVIDSGLVKTKRFKNPNYVGDPINAVKIFSDKCVDELVIVDIRCTKKNNAIDFDLIHEVASECFMPVCYGGGIRQLSEAKKIITLGIEKLSFNSAFDSEPKLPESVAEIFGNQSVVCAIDVKKNFFGKQKAFVSSGQKATKYSAVEMAKRAEDYGAGEIFINSIANDGMRCGYDLELIQEVANAVDIPVVALGGAHDIKDFMKAIEFGASAVAAGSMFVYHGAHNAVLISYLKEEELRDLNDAFGKR